MTQSLTRLLTCIVALLSMLYPAHAGSFDGQTITYIVATKPGGGYDTYGRLIAKYLEKHLPGSSVQVKNIPGAGHRVGAETIYASPADGLTIGTFNIGIIYGQIVGSYGTTLDLSKLSWIGKAASDTRVVVASADSRFKSIADVTASKEPVKVAVNAKGSSAHFESSLLATLLGWNMKQIYGFDGTEGELSVIRGDVDLVIGSLSSYQQYLNNGQMRILLSFGGPASPGVKQLQRSDFDDSKLAMFSLIDGLVRFSRVTAAPPGVPDAVLAELRQAYEETLADPLLREEAKKLDIPIDPGKGEDIGAVISAALHQSPEVVALIKQIVEE